MRFERRPLLTGALTGGAVASVVLFAIVFGIGRIASFKALGLIEALVPTARFLGGSALGALVTVLALLLTLLGFSLSGDLSFHRQFYVRVRQISVLSVIGIVIGVMLLLAVTIPLSEVEEIAIPYVAFYYVLTSAMALLGGLIVSVALLIGSTIRGVIAIGKPGARSDLIADEDSRREGR